MTPDPADTVFLYNGPHPVHRLMAERIGAEFVECEKGGPVDRVRAALSRRFDDRPVLIEGGVPLLEAGVLGTVGQCGPIVELAADATLIDVKTPLEGRPRHERLAHAFGERAVDATVTVSDYIAAYARTYDRPVEVVHPFVDPERYDRLVDLPPGGDPDTLLCVGKYRHKNGQDLLRRAVEHLEGVTVHFVGPDTEDVPSHDRVERHGFVDLEDLYELVERAGLMVYPARVGAYPVAVLEALVGGTPVVTTPFVGNVDLVRAIHPKLVVDPDPRAVADRVGWAGDRDLAELGRRAREIGREFRADPYLEEFERRYQNVLAALQ